jgi:hypothetical protein
MEERAERSGLGGTQTLENRSNHDPSSLSALNSTQWDTAPGGRMVPAKRSHNTAHILASSWEESDTVPGQLLTRSLLLRDCIQHDLGTNGLRHKMCFRVRRDVE